MRRISFKRFLSAFVATAGVGLPLQIQADTTAIWDGSTSNWTDASHWSTTPVFPNNSGGSFFDAAVSAGTVTLNQNIAINQLSMSGGSLAGSSTLALAEGLAWSGGTFAFPVAGGLTLGSGSTSGVTASPVFASGRIIGGGGASFSIPAGATLTVLNDASFFADAVSPLWTLTNAGTLVSRGTMGAGFTSMDAIFNNTGAARVELSGGSSQTLSLAGGGKHSGTFALASGTALELGNNTTLQNGVSFTGSGTVYVAGNVVLAGSVSGTNLTVAVGELNIGSSVLHVTGAAAQTGGTMRINGGTFRVASGSGTLTMDDGMLTGAGTVHGSLQAQGGIAPEGTLSVTGATMFGGDACLSLDLSGTSTGSFDRLISDTATLAGTLEVRVINGFQPAPTDSFTVLTAPGGVSGFFDNVPLDGMRFETADGQGSFAIDYTATSVVLTQFIPEPSAAVFATLGGALSAVRRRRRDKFL